MVERPLRLIVLLDRNNMNEAFHHLVPDWASTTNIVEPSLRRTVWQDRKAITEAFHHLVTITGP